MLAPAEQTLCNLNLKFDARPTHLTVNGVVVSPSGEESLLQ